ncbi:pirin family protein [Yanghanlia caeni]|uniref:Pirin family protein n=1 Tax=Yanghanlia caeni TaxID=3064283 RepID=A0ABU1D752_9BURK|nr:pirin family protein [Alcaligenaceae bacterium LG-2]NGR09637.1 pirin family protein [bacterium SGD-2]HZH57015.1 pirin family protein [Burkholderiaceae bacterium]
MLEIRRSDERGVAEHGWLSSRHSFSFAHYYDPEHMGFGPLRVINEDRVLPGRGFGMHGHSDMEIISYVLSGALEHKDSMGNGSVLRYGDVQRMSAGTGVMHSEFNPSSTEPVHFLQIWIMPDTRGVAPSYEEKHFDTASKTGQWRLIASPDGRDGSVRIHQNAHVHAAILGESDALGYEIADGRGVYLHVARGSVTVNGTALNAGDAVKLVQAPRIEVANAADAEVLLFDLPVQ